MGIVFALVYLPSLAIVILLSIYTGIKLKAEGEAGILGPFGSAGSLVAGVLCCCAITWLAVLSMYRFHRDLEGTFWAVAITVLLPFLMGSILTATSFRKARDAPQRKFYLCLNRFGIGTLHTVWIIPASFVLFRGSEDFRYSLTREHREAVARYEVLCRDDRIDIRSTAANVRSVYTSKYRVAHSLLKSLEFAEIDRDQGYGPGWQDPGYVRITKDTSSTASPGVSYERIDSLTSQYEVVLNDITIPSDKAKSLFVEELTIRDRQNGRVLAVVSHVNMTGKGNRHGEYYCPQIAPPNVVASYVLGLMSADEASRFEAQVAAYHKERGSVK